MIARPNPHHFISPSTKQCFEAIREQATARIALNVSIVLEKKKKQEKRGQSIIMECR
jgi:hypothetical protein